MTSKVVDIGQNVSTKDDRSVLLQRCEALPYNSKWLRGIKSRTTIIHPFRMDVPHGSITAILGTAESGKSTLLKFMAGCSDKNLSCEGTVRLPGTSSYLPEHTSLHRHYTPRTYIKHYDRLLSCGER
jgi:ABC-type multidrug transport system ATPase subunit